MVSGAYKSEYGDSDEITQCLNEVAVSCTYMYIREQEYSTQISYAVKEKFYEEV
jgi:hypothetical protein